MTRKKVKLAWIANDNARRASLKKRRLGLLKKVSELTTLCGTDACLIIYSPEETEPMVWPSNAEVHRQLALFSKLPELERMKKMVNQETYLKEKVNKTQEQLRKQQKRNKEVEMGYLMFQIDQGNRSLDELNVNELDGVAWLLEEKMKEIRKRIDFFEQVPIPPERPALEDVHGHGPILPSKGPEDGHFTANNVDVADTAGGDHGRITTDNLLLDQWLNDMMNNNKLRSAPDSASSSGNMRCDMGLPYYPFAAGISPDDMGLPFSGSSSNGAVMGMQPPFGNCRGSRTTSDMGLPPLGFRSMHGGETDMGELLPHYGSVGGGGSSFSTFGSDMGLELHSFGHVGSSSTGNEFGRLPFGLFGGRGGGNGSSSAAAGIGSDMGMGVLPFDGKSWPNNDY